MTDYLTLDEVRRLIGTDNQGEDFTNRYLDLIAEASAVIERETNRRFDHRIETIGHNALPIGRGGDVKGSYLYLQADLQSVHEIVNGDGTVLTSDDYELLLDETSGQYHSQIDLLNGCWTYTGRPDRAIRVTGIWGYGGGWKVETTLAADATDVEDTLTLAAAISSPRQVLRINDEYLQVEEVDDETVTVTRAVNGSTAVSHSTGATVYSFQPDAYMRRIMKALLRWHEKLEDNPQGMGTMVVGDDEYTVDFSAMPKHLARQLEALKRNRYRLHSTGKNGR